MSIVLNKSDFLFKNQLSKYEGKVREVYTLKNDIMIMIIKMITLMAMIMMLMLMN